MFASISGIPPHMLMGFAGIPGFGNIDFGSIFGGFNQQQSQNQQQQQTPQPPQQNAPQTGPDYGFGPSTPTMGPGQHTPNYQTGDSPILKPPGAPPVQTQQAFTPPNQWAPYYNAAGVAGNLGTMIGQAAPGATEFIKQIFNPGMTPMEAAFMSAGLGNALVGLNEGMTRQESMFEGTPFHSGLLQSQGDVMEQMSRDMFQTAGQMGMQRQQLAGAMAQMPFDVSLQNALVGPTLMQQMSNQAQQNFMNPLSFPTQIWTGIPISAPAVVANQGGGGGK